MKLMILSLTSLLILLTGCTSTPASNKQDDVLTNKKTSDNRTRISILVKYAFDIHGFEKIIEEKFPDIDIVQVGNYTSNTTLAKEYEARLKNDDLTDIVMTWPYEVGEEYWKERLIDLSGMSFSSKYNASMLNSIESKDGGLYYVPGPAQIRGIVYNKTMFEENGWQVPTNYEEFIALSKQIDASGTRAFQLPLGNSEVLDTAFIGFNYGNAYGKPTDAKWLDEYDKGNGKFIDHFSKALNTFSDLIAQGIIRQEDLDATYADTQSNLYNRKIAMSEDSILTARWAKTMSPIHDDFSLMPFFTKNPENDWTRIYMVCYIGLNKHLQESENKETYEKVLKVMEFISTPEGQKALASGNGAMFSSLRNAETPNDDEIKDLNSSISQGRYGVFPTLQRSENALRLGLQGMLLQTMDANELAISVDKENRLPQNELKSKKLTKATDDFTMIETGNLICDILKKEAKSDIALFLDNGKDGLYNGKGISAKLYKGNIYEEDVERVFPDLKHGELGELQVIEMSGENLLKTLEYSLDVDNQTGWFYYFSGLTLTYEPCAKLGSRISKVTLSNGDAIQKNKLYRVAIMDKTVDEDYMITSENTGIKIKDLLVNRLKDMKTITPSKDERFTIKE